MGKLAAIIVAAVLAGGLGGAAMASALGSSDKSSSTPQPTLPDSPAPRAKSEKLTPEAIYRDVAPGVVVISSVQKEKIPATFFNPPSSQEVQVSGSGFVLDRQGDIVTNDHVVQGSSTLRVGFSGGATYPAKVVGADPSTDLAVIRVSAPSSALDPLTLADSSQVSVGDTVYAIGNPFGLDRTMTAGIVSALGRDIQAPNGLGIPNAIQTDAPINHGNSGGPLLDTAGRVVGINDQIETGGTVDGNVGVGFAVASDTAKSVVPQLLAHGRVAHAWLGVEVGPIDPQVANAVKGIPDQGVLVLRVTTRSPAARAGLKAGTEEVTVNGETVLVGGDAITAVGGTSIHSPDQLANLVRSRKPGDELTLQVSRRGKTRQVHVVLGYAPGNS